MSSSRKQSRSSDEWKAYPAITEEPHICYCTKRGAPGQSHAYPQKGSNFGMRILHRFISRMHRPFTGPSFGIRAMSNSACELGTRVRAGIWKEGGFRQMDAARDQLLVSNLKPCSSAIATSHCLCYVRACLKNAFVADRLFGARNLTDGDFAQSCRVLLRRHEVITVDHVPLSASRQDICT
ncbi:hypothetical protein M438DRAFT_54540 [Aureobasidium pullulans EXF-150]|uniref:Uncharacterized protein n=1 Tax=Aureobasidium pullulans EXF-150 TaxID=1043002 RepID=A0A074XAP9_AURPU|nr:uncharacterized protein M438DRAFT_54540 [Aureobasidium pullulans EXF-150]KEQ82600.1 hypothetical protein M438DRAFT_54540 [Aureobasidium pullulans EXF-150]